MYFIKLSAYVKIIEDIAIGHFPQSLSRYLSLSLLKFSLPNNWSETTETKTNNDSLNSCNNNATYYTWSLSSNNF